MRILGLIPARGGSKGIPGKNIKLLGGKPLLAYTAESAIQSRLLTHIIVSSEDDDIIEVARKSGIEVPFQRPAPLSADDTPTIKVLEHALEWFLQEGIVFDAVCLLQVTTPFRTPGFIDDAITKFIDSGSDSLISVQKVPHQFNPHWTFEPDGNGNLKIATGEETIISRRQELPVAYHRDGSIYITKADVITGQKSLYGKSVSFIESDAPDYVNIDTMEDWIAAESIINNINTKNRRST